MTPQDAIALIVKHYPGGVDAFVEVFDKSRETLAKEFRGGDPKFKLGLNQAVRVSQMAIAKKSEHCYAFINAVSAGGGGFVRLPVVDMSGPVNLQRSMSDVIKEMSDVATSTIEGDADDVISDNDRDRALKEISEARAALQQHEANILRKHAAGRPAHLRAAA